MNRILSILLITILSTCFIACSSNETTYPSDGSADRSAHVSADEPETEAAAPISLSEFETQMQSVGTAQELSGDAGYDAALINGADGTRYIYMSLPDEALAAALIAEDEGEIVKEYLLKEKSYELLQVEEIDEAGEALLEYCLRVENMLLIIAGPASEPETVKQNANICLKQLGYSSIAEEGGLIE